MPAIEVFEAGAGKEKFEDGARAGSAAPASGRVKQSLPCQEARLIVPAKTDMESKYLGKTVKRPIEELDSFPAPEGVSEVTMTSDEVTSACPITGQPDLYTVEIRYCPRDRCIESKSLKLYLWGFSEKAMFAEKIAAEICDRVVADIAPRSCRVTTVQKARGGISIESVAVYPREN